MNIRHLFVSALLACSSAFLSPAAQAQINAAASMTGALDAVTFSATVVPTENFVNNGSKFWLALLDKNGGIYFSSGSQDNWMPYNGGIAPEYGVINAPSMSIGFTRWNVSQLVGSQIFIGYGHSFEEMLVNNRFALVQTIQGPAAPRPPTAEEIQNMTALALENIPLWLRSPSTFRVIGTPSWSYYDTLGKPNEGAITINFDSQNGFGALIRTKAICGAKWDDRGYWRNVLNYNLALCYFY